MSEEKKLKAGHFSRWLVALILTPPTLLAFLGPYEFVLLILVAVMGGLAWWEFSVNLFGRDRPGLFVLALAGWLLTALGAYVYGPEGQQLGLVLALGLGAAYLMNILGTQPDKVAVNLVSRLALGHIYLSFMFTFAFLIKKQYYGGHWLLYTVLVTALADTGAFYAGSYLKGPKLFKKISPNKTISGLIGGCISAMVVGGLSSYYLPDEFSWAQLAILGLFLGFCGAYGDLFESALKRAMGIKDTSAMLLGHGGIWDRLDSILFNLPPVYLFIFWQAQP